MSRILVTGGCGYIGSHVAQLLHESGHSVFIIDDLSTGRASSIRSRCTEFILGKVSAPWVKDLLIEEKISTVMHFAGSIVVSESMEKPTEYYLNNTRETLDLLSSCEKSRVENFIFSSTGAVYRPQYTPIREEAQTEPISPYADSKYLSEHLVRNICGRTGIGYAILRYFNVAGARHEVGLGQVSKKSTHLIKIIAEYAVGKRDHVPVFGSDYDTDDGTCVRDYIHVSDLATAHLKAMEHLEADGHSGVFNCGYGHGYSVLEVLSAAERVLGKEITTVLKKRREGDTTALVANTNAIRSVLNWSPKHDDLEAIIGSAIEWERQLAAEPT